jgi:hypothetical protein
MRQLKELYRDSLNRLRLIKLFPVTFILTAIMVLPYVAYSQESTSLQESLIKAQIENEGAQAKYYKSLTAPKTFWQGWGQLILSLIGSVIGASAALGGIYLTNQARRKDEVSKENRLAVAELTKNLAAGLQAISWITWTAKNGALTKDHISEYTGEMKKLLPAIVGSRAVLAALNKTAHNEMSPLVVRLYKLDAAIGEAALSFRESQRTVRDTLTGYYADSENYDNDLTAQVAEILDR